ncbi:MAG: hypothetical protein JWO19_1762 [Bryobacterales bacterium]|nr:hypothetical protein [Bryobacterales bacterium]
MKKLSAFQQVPLFAAALFAIFPAFAQTTTSISLANIRGVIAAATAGRPISLSGTGSVSPFGNATVNFSGSKDQLTTGLTQGTFTFFFNRVDSFNVTLPPQAVGKIATLTLPAPITGGTGAYLGATGSVTCTLKYTAATSSDGTFTLTGSGTITVGQTTTAISFVDFNGTASVTDTLSGTLTATPVGSVVPFGNVTVNFSGMKSLSSPGRIQGTLTFVFNANDSFTASFSFLFAPFTLSASLPCTITGGTGAFRGASGSLAATITLSADISTFSLTGSGTITQPPPGTPVITSVKTAFGSPSIAQNTWLEIKGLNLAPSNTPAGGVYWSNAPEFALGRMPTQIGGVSVTVNDKPAYVWWFCSAVTTSACESDQINVLSPLDNTLGPVQVFVTSQNVSSAPMIVNMQSIAPSFLLFDTTGHSVATHTDFRLLGPASLFPGLSTPARPQEVAIVWAIGFGLPATSLLAGSATQTGSLPVLPVCQIGSTPATVTTAVLVGPGLYALFVVVPSGAINGDNVVSCTYRNSTTPAGNLITVQR